MTALRTWWLVVAAALAGVVITMTIGTLTGEIVYFGCYAVVCIAAWWAALRPVAGSGARADRRPWLLIALGQTLLLLGDAVMTVFFYFLPEASPVGWMDVPWLGGYAAIGAGLMIMARRRARGQLREPLLDMLTLTTAATLGLWRVMIDPELTASGGQYTAEILLDASYMVGDVLIMAAVLLLVLSPGVRGVPTRLMIVAASAARRRHRARDVAVRGDRHVRQRGHLLRQRVDGDHHDAVRPRGAGPPRPPDPHPAPGPYRLPRPRPADRSGHRRGRGLGSGGERLALLIATVAASGFVLTRFTVAVRQQERAEQLLTYQASYDPLTGLANRRTILSRLEESVAGDVLLYLDLDGFKAVNDTHGHEAGDALLVEIGNRLSGAVRDGDLVARLGGDEFALLCPGPADVSEITALAERLLAVVTEPVGYHGHELRVGTSIGIAVHAGGVTSPAT
nr:hypothetical protein GCM10020093_118400 [Planobispora longispora]